MINNMTLATYRLPDEVRDAMTNVLQQLSDNTLLAGYTTDPYQKSVQQEQNRKPPEIFYQVLKEEFASIMSDDVMASLQALYDGTGAPAVLIENMPIGETPPTPEGKQTIGDKDLVSEFAAYGIHALMDVRPPDHLFATTQIKPTREHADNPTRASSANVDLRLHTDGVHLDEPPEMLSLMCLRGHEEAATPFYRLEDVFSCFTEAEIEILKQPRFQFAHYEHLDAENDPVFSILEERPHGLTMRLRASSERIHGLDEDAQNVIDKLVKRLETVEPSESATLKAGDFLIFDQQRVAHNRTKFSLPDDPGEWRWLGRSVLNRVSPEVVEERNQRYQDTDTPGRQESIASIGKQVLFSQRVAEQIASEKDKARGR